MNTSALVRLSVISRNEVAQIGNVKVIETEYELEKTILENSETLRLEQNSFYLLDDGIFIPLREASRKSGLSQKLLLALCEKEILLGKKLGKVWVVNNASLENLINLIWSVR